MNKITRTGSLVLSLTLALGLFSGCGSAAPGSTPSPDKVYVPQYTKLEGLAGGINLAETAEGRLFLTAEVESGPVLKKYQKYDENGEPLTDAEGKPVMEEESVTENVPAVFTLDAAGGGLARFEGYSVSALPEGAEGSVELAAIRPLAGGGLAALERLSYSLPQEEVYRESCLLRIFDAKGAETAKREFGPGSEEGGESPSFTAMAADAQGRIFLMDQTGGRILAVDGSGAELGAVRADEQTYLQGLFQSAAGEVYAMTPKPEGGGIDLHAIDLGSKKLGQTVHSLSYEAYGAYSGGGGYDACYNEGESFCALRLGAQPERLLSWINCDINSSSVVRGFVSEGGEVLCLLNDYDGGGGAYLVRLVPTPADQVKPKTTLSLACNYLDYDVRRAVLDFNRKNAEFRIEVRDYSQYNTDEDYGAGLTKLTTEIGAGSVPDILLTNGIPMESFAAKGLFTDLWPFIEADSRFGGREGLVQPFFNALSREGKLYEITGGFTLQTLAGPSSVVGTQPGWSFDQLRAALDKMPQGCEVFSRGWTRRDVFANVCSLSMGGFVDWKNGVCRFDTGEFADLLRFTELFPEEYKWDDDDFSPKNGEEARIREGRQMLRQMYINSLYSYSYDASLYGKAGMTLIGYPGVPGSGAVFSYSGGLAISEACKNKNVAWDFISYCLDPDHQQDAFGGLPTNKAVFDKLFRDNIGEKMTSYSDDGTEMETVFTEDYARSIQDVINSTVTVSGRTSGTLSSIINEEAEGFFAGQKSADEVARNIQNRASIYVNEQR